MATEEASAPATAAQADAAPAAPPAPPPAAPPQAAGGETPDWRTGLPPEIRDALGDDADPAEAAKTYARGAAYKPAQRPEDITLDPGKGDLHPGLEKLFKDMCIAQKMTPAQARAVADFHGRFSAEASRLYLEHGNAELERRFGADTAKVKDNALKMFAGLDRAMDGRLSAGASGRQIASDPVAVEALALLYQKLGEDALGASSPSGGEEKAMSDKEFYEHVFSTQTRGARTPL